MNRVRQPREKAYRIMVSSRSRSRRALSASPSIASGSGPTPTPTPARSARRRGVGHETNVSLVHTHAEGVGRSDDVDPPGQEVVLYPGALVVVETGVVPPGPETLARQEVGPELHRLSGSGVDNSRWADLRE